MFGYSLTRPMENKDYYYDIFNTCDTFGCNIEGWHTESGPGVFEAALEFGEIKQMADRASLFKSVVPILHPAIPPHALPICSILPCTPRHAAKQRMQIRRQVGGHKIRHHAMLYGKAKAGPTR